MTGRATPYRVPRPLVCLLKGHTWKKVDWDRYQCQRCGKQRHSSWFNELSR